MISQIFFLAPCGRSGSVLTHVLLQSNSNVVMPEGLGMFKTLEDPTQVNSSILTQFCRTSIKETNLWSLEPKEIPANYLDLERSHENCGCSRLITNESRIVVHLHNLLYDYDDFESFTRFQSIKSPSFVVSFLLPTRTSWLANISSRCKTTSTDGLPRILQIVYWCSIERQAWRARCWIEDNFPSLNLPVERWHNNGAKQWDELHDFLGLENTQFPAQLNISGNKWTGGIQTDNFVDPEHAKKLFEAHLSRFETWLANRFKPGINQSSRFQQLVALALSITTDSIVWTEFYALGAIKRVWRELKTRNHRKNPTYINQTFSAIAKILDRAVSRTRIGNLYEGLGQYQFARRNLRRWSHLFKNLQ